MLGLQEFTSVLGSNNSHSRFTKDTLVDKVLCTLSSSLLEPV